jgi:hypothetical protein
VTGWIRAERNSGAYTNIHAWMRRNYSLAGRCEFCGRTDRKTEYATARPGYYSRNRGDWFEFCQSCHAKFDGRVGAAVNRSEQLKGNTNSVGRVHPSDVRQKIAEGVRRYWAERATASHRDVVAKNLQQNSKEPQ